MVGLFDLFTFTDWREKSPSQKRKKFIQPAVINDDPGSNAFQSIREIHVKESKKYIFKILRNTHSPGVKRAQVKKEEVHSASSDQR